MKTARSRSVPMRNAVDMAVLGEKAENRSPLSPFRSTRLSQNSFSSCDSDKTLDTDDDEDAGVYADSHRYSQWLYVSREDLLEHEGLNNEFEDDLNAICGLKSHGCEKNSTETESTVSEHVKESHHGEPATESPLFNGLHSAQDVEDVTEPNKLLRERRSNVSRQVIHRKSSSLTYRRASRRSLEEERVLKLHKNRENEEFGFQIHGWAPVVVSDVEPGSIAEMAALQLYDVIIGVNDVDVSEATHEEVVKLINQEPSCVKLQVMQEFLACDRPLCSGYLQKQGGGSLLRKWRKLWCVLKSDNCLYYFKRKDDNNPLGAVVLSRYTVAKTTEVSRQHVLKLSKYGQRTMYFQAESEADMNRWAWILNGAAQSTSSSTLTVSSHNVGLPALSIRDPECHGSLHKQSNRHRHWQRRYCVLKDACLYYYLEHNSSTAQGVAHLHGYRVCDATDEANVSIVLNPPLPKMRRFVLKADSASEAVRWKKALVKSISKWKQVGLTRVTAKV